jgi:hypothetical protein
MLDNLGTSTSFYNMKPQVISLNPRLILANGKVGIGYPMHRISDGNVGIKSLDIDFQKLLADAKNGTWR